LLKWWRRWFRQRTSRCKWCLLQHHSRTKIKSNISKSSNNISPVVLLLQLTPATLAAPWSPCGFANSNLSDFALDGGHGPGENASQTVYLKGSCPCYRVPHTCQIVFKLIEYSIAAGSSELIRVFQTRKPTTNEPDIVECAGGAKQPHLAQQVTSINVTVVC
jgi:hypothetical protein